MADSSAASPWYAAWPPHPPEGDEACPTCGYGLDDGSGTEHECPPGYRDQAAASVDNRLLRAIDTADKGTSMTAFGPVNDKWMRRFLAALADEGLAIVEVETT